VTAARRRARPSPATRDGLTTDDGRDGRRESPCLTTAAHVAHHGDAYTVSVGQGSGHTHTPLLGTVASGPGGPPGLLMTTKYRQPVGRTGVVRAYARVLRTSETWGARRQLRTWQPKPTTTTSSGRTTGAATLRDTAAPPNQEDAAPHRIGRRERANSAYRVRSRTQSTWRGPRTPPRIGIRAPLLPAALDLVPVAESTSP
jgi:hypothetical protein